MRHIFGTGGFHFAVKLLYDEPNLRGDIAAGESQVEHVSCSTIDNYLYVTGKDSPKVIKR